MTNHSKEYTVHGVSAEMLRGNENTVYSPAWFVEVNGSYFWTYKNPWTSEDLRGVRDDEREFIFFLEESERVPLKEGEQVYLAGRDFMVKILSFAVIGAVKVSVRDWKQLSNGYYIATMDPEEFNAYGEHLAMELWKIVEKFLIGGNSVSKDMVKDAFDAYTAVAYYSADDKKEQSIRRAMFYMFLGDAHMLEVESRFSVELDKFFDTTEKFRSAVQQRLDSLKH